MKITLNYECDKESEKRLKYDQFSWLICPFLEEELDNECFCFITNKHCGYNKKGWTYYSNINCKNINNKDCPIIKIEE